MAKAEFQTSNQHAEICTLEELKGASFGSVEAIFVAAKSGKL